MNPVITRVNDFNSSVITVSSTTPLASNDTDKTQTKEEDAKLKEYKERFDSVYANGISTSECNSQWCSEFVSAINIGLVELNVLPKAALKSLHEDD